MKFKICFLSFFAATTIAFAQIPTNGLIAYYPFNGNATDESANSNDGTVYGATLTADRFGNPNSAYYFNGTSDYIEVQDDPSLNPANITIATWIKPEIASSHTPDIIRKSTYSNANNEEYVLRLTSDVNADFELKINVPCSTVGSWTANNQPSALNLNEWSFLVATYDSTSLKLYVNGILVKTVTTAQSAIVNCPGGTLRIGLAWNNYPNYYKGTIDNIRIYDRAITQTEVTSLYNENICAQSITVTDTLLINLHVTGFNPITYKNTIKVFPNPTKNNIIIDNGDYASLSGYTVKIVNVLGQTVFTSIVNQQQFTIDLSTWSGSGIYFINIIDDQNRTLDIKKVVLQ